MNIIENFFYSFLFLTNRLINLSFSESIFSKYENYMISKYLSKREIQSQDIPIIQKDELTNEIFLQLSNNYRKPIIIKEFFKDSNAVQNWDLDYFKGILNNFELDILDKDAKEINKIKYDDFYNRVKTENIYINNNSSIFCNFPKIFNDIQKNYFDFKKIIHSFNLSKLHVIHLFMGYNSKDKISGTNIHCAGNGNMFCMIKGIKKWVLIDPKYSFLLKGRLSKSGIHAQSLFDMPDFDISKTPDILKHIPRYEINLEPGDVLWNAPWWWHRIQNLNQDSENIGIAIRYPKITYKLFQNNFLYSISGYNYFIYNSLFIKLYEKLFSSKEIIQKEIKNDKNNNVLNQIKELTKKHPETLQLSDIINIHLKDK